MITLVTGGAACGKSSYAEEILAKYDGAKYYVATMHKDDTDETLKRVLRHQQMRKNRGFETVELETDILRVVELCNDDRKSCIIECMSNLLANEMYISKKKDAHLSIIDDIKRIVACFDNVVIVTNEVASDGISYDEFTSDYICSIQYINKELAKISDRVIEVVYSIPVVIKGEQNENY